MSSYTHMSLDDIIKKKRKETRAKRSKVRPDTFKSVCKMAPIMDARYKVLSKKRICITDAREKLTQLAKQKDARFKLDQLRQERRTVHGPDRNTTPNRGIFTRAPPAAEIDSSRQVTLQPLATAMSKIGLKHQIRSQTFNAARSIEKPRLFEFQHKTKPKPLLQAAVQSDLQIIDDSHLEEEYVPQPLAMINRKLSMQVKIIAQTTDGCANKVAANHRTVVAEKEKTTQIPPLLIPIPNKLPMATLRSDIIAKKIAQNIEKPRLEYRIIVSNLSPTVTGADIQELFGDVGLMLESRLVRPGIAEVIYQTQNDAQAAVDLYHNRHLDGQPTNCLVVTPRAPSTNCLVVTPRAPSTNCLVVTPRAPSTNCLVVTPRAPSTNCLVVTPRAPSTNCLVVTPRAPSTNCLVVTPRAPSTNCLVVTPRAPSTTARSSFSNKPELCRTHTNGELDLSTLH